jgi:hypothetical protein
MTASRTLIGRAGVLVGLLRRLNRRGADLVFALLLSLVVLLAGWLLARHDRSWDWTLSGRNSLSEESLAVLAALEAPLEIRVFAADDDALMPAIEQVLQPYRRASDRVRVQTIDPQLFPEAARAAGVRLQGQLVLEYRDRRVSLEVLNERALTNAIARLQLEDAPWVVVLEGHGERALEGGAAGDLRRFAQLLIQRGFRLQPLDLALQGQVPDNTDLLLVSTPAIDLFPGEAQALVDYLERGGNLLWLLDPPGDQGLLGLEPLRDALGLKLLPGQIVDAAAGDLRLEAPTFAVVEDWPAHPLTADLRGPALFPGAVALEMADNGGWQQPAALRTGALSWNETGAVRGEISRNPQAHEQPGPLDVALLLTRGLDQAAEAGPARRRGEPRTQRVAIIGDGDFIANAHLEQGANQALGLQLLRWLTHRDDLIAVPPPPNDRVAIELSHQRILLLTVGGLFLLPAALVLVGLVIHWSRARDP